MAPEISTINFIRFCATEPIKKKLTKKRRSKKILDQVEIYLVPKCKFINIIMR